MASLTAVVHDSASRLHRAATASDTIVDGSGATLTPTPVGASYVTLGTNAILTDERVLTPESSVLSLTDAGAGSTVTLGIAANGVTNAKLRQSAGLSVLGRSANSTGDIADLTAVTSGHSLRLSGTTLGFGLVDLSIGVTGALATGTVPLSQVTAGTAPAGTFIFPTLQATSSVQINAAVAGNALNFQDAGTNRVIVRLGASTLTYDTLMRDTGGAAIDTPLSIVIASAGQMNFGGSSNRSVNLTGHLIANADNTKDIGASGATRFRAAFYGSASVMGRTLATTLTLADGDCLLSTDYYAVDTGGELRFDGDSELEIA